MSSFVTPAARQQRIDELENALRNMIDAFELPPGIKNRHPDLRHSIYNVQLAVLDAAKKVLGKPQKSAFNHRTANDIIDSDRQAEIAVKGL